MTLFKLISAAALLAICLPFTAIAQTELMADDLETDAGLSWKGKTDGRGGIDITMETIDEELALAAIVDVADIEGEAPDIRMHRVFGTFDNSRSYKISFSVKAREPTMIVAFVAPESAGHLIAWRVEVPVTNEWTEHRFQFTPQNAAEDGMLGFSQLGKASNTFWFKDVTVTSD